jgi:hypothetical protein
MYATFAYAVIYAGYINYAQTPCPVKDKVSRMGQRRGLRMNKVGICPDL